MKKILFKLLLTLPFIGFGQNTYNLEETKWNNDSTIRLLKSNSQPINGIVTGSDDKKIKNHKMVFENGIKVSCIGYYKNGKLNHDVKFNGYSKSCYKNGQIKEEGNTEDGYYSGLWKYYNKKGVLTEESIFKEGEELVTKYYNKKGLLIFEQEWIGDNSYLIKEYWDGNLLEEGNYIDGKKDGVWKYYISDESLDGKEKWIELEKEVIFKNGKKVKN